VPIYTLNKGGGRGSEVELVDLQAVLNCNLVLRVLTEFCLRVQYFFIVPFSLIVYA